MNKDRRAALDKAIELLESCKGSLEAAKSIIEDSGNDERECYDALTEGLQNAERGERMSEVADELDSIANDLDIDIDDFITRLNDCQN